VLPEKLGGLPANAPARPAEASPFPNVYAPEQPRDVRSLSEDEQKKLGSDLLQLRDGQVQRAKDPEEAERKAAAEKRAADKAAADKRAADRKAALKKKRDEKKTAEQKQGDGKPAEGKPLELKAN